MTYHRVVVSVKATGPDPAVHIPVEVAWWDLVSGRRGVFVPAHHPKLAMANCDIDTIDAIGYVPRLARARQDEDATAAAVFAEALQESVIVSTGPWRDTQLIRRMFDHYLNDHERVQPLAQPHWFDVLDVGSYAAGILGLPTRPDLTQVCELLGVPLESARTAETDVDAIGRCVQRLAELAEVLGKLGHAHRTVLAALPSTSELSTHLAEAIDRATFDLIAFHGEGEGQTYTIACNEIAGLAAGIYGPVIAGLREKVETTTRQLREVAESSRNAGEAWRAEIDKLTVERDQALEPVEPITDEQLRVAVARGITTSLGERLDDEHGNRVIWLRAADAALKPVAAELHNLRRKIGQVIAAHVEESNRLRAELAEATNAPQTPDSAQIQDTPWDPFTLPVTELSIGPATAPRVPSELHPGDVLPAELAPEFETGTPSTTVVAVGTMATVVGPARAADVVAALAGPAEPARPEPAEPEPVSALATRYYLGYDFGPLPICPAPLDCGHPRAAHDVEDEHDPIPMCGADGCRCGHAPRRWRRIPDQRVYGNGDTIPAGVRVLAQDGSVYGAGLSEDWINQGLGPVVEVRPYPSPGPVAPAAIEEANTSA